MNEAIDWTALRRAAITASTKAYVPYSKFAVGAAALTTSGRVIAGCNVENVSYGMTLCAECAVVSALLSTGGATSPVMKSETPRERLVALSCVDAEGVPITPCGRCRQLLAEHAAPAMLVELDGDAPIRLSQLLPHAFTVANLDAVDSSQHALRDTAHREEPA